MSATGDLDTADKWIGKARDELARKLIVAKRSSGDGYDALVTPMPVPGSATGARWLAEAATAAEAARCGFEILQQEAAAKYGTKWVIQDG